MISTRRRRTSSSIDDSGFYSQNESNNEQVLQLLNRLLESENLSAETQEAVNSMKELIQSQNAQNDFAVELESTCSFDDIIGHEGIFRNLIPLVIRFQTSKTYCSSH